MGFTKGFEANFITICRSYRSFGGSNYCTFSMINSVLIQIKKDFTPPTSYNVDQNYGN
jgi:hypothetical protein